MRVGSILWLPLCLLSAAVVAQTATTPAASDAWRQPVATAGVATSAAASHPSAALPGDDAKAGVASFKFKHQRKSWMKEPPPPEANDKAAVMGTQRAWLGGRPPVACAQTPHDPACR